MTIALLSSLRTLVLLLLLPLAYANCYKPDGSLVKDQQYQPCNQIAGTFSMCCGTNRTNPSGGNINDGWTKDICLENGLCQNVAMINGKMAYAYWRVYCSDQSWEGCLANVCEKKGETAELTPCDGVDGMPWCCGRNNTACCDDGSAVRIPKILGEKLISTSSSSTTTSAPTGVVFTTSGSATTITTSTRTVQTFTATPTPGDGAPPKSLSTGAKAGIAVGVVLGLAAILGILLFCAPWRKTQQKGEKLEEELSAVLVAEVPAIGPFHEMEGGDVIGAADGRYAVYQTYPAVGGPKVGDGHV